MGSVLTLIGIFLVGLMLIALFVKWYTALCYRLIVSDKSDVLEGVLTTREVPRAWRKQFMEALARGANPFSRGIGRLLICLYSRRIRGLIAFVGANRRMNAEEKKADIETLREIQDEWRQCRTIAELF